MGSDLPLWRLLLRLRGLFLDPLNNRAQCRARLVIGRLYQPVGARDRDACRAERTRQQTGLDIGCRELMARKRHAEATGRRTQYEIR